MRLRTLISAFGIAAMLACNADGLFGPGDQKRLATAKARWEGRPFQNYSYEVRKFCFCPPEVIQWNRVEVRNGVVVQAEAVDPDSGYPLETTSFFQPIDSLFTSLERVYSESIFSSPYSKILVEYDATLGFPRYIEYREKPTVADAALTINLRNVVPIN